MAIGIRIGVFSAIFCFLAAVFMPALTYQSPAFLVSVVVAVLCAAAIPMKSDFHERGRGRYRAVELKPSYSGRLVYTSGACLVVTIICNLCSWSLLRTDSYFQLLGEEKFSKFEASLPPINLQNAPLVSESMALRAAEKKLSEVPALGSQVRVGELVKQLVNGELQWVAFLETRGFFKWLERSSTPGYVMVSATDASDVRLVTELGGKPLELKYLPSAYFWKNDERHLYFSGMANQQMTNFSAEIDESGRPYMVATLFTRKAMWGGSDATGTVVLDVQTGEYKTYSIKDTPDWVDRIQPERFVAEQLKDRLYYVHGWLNPSDKDRLSISGGLDIVYGRDGRSYYFAGHTSTAREGGMVSFSLIDTRTKEAYRYSMSGVTERVAQAAAEGVNPEKRYEATNALPFMVDGTPAYVMALRDATGIARAYAMVAIEDFQKVAVAETLSATARLFQAKLTMDKTRLDASSTAELAKIKTRVLRRGTEVRGGNTSYLFVLDGQGDKLFAAGPDLSENLAVTSEGDVVVVQYASTTSRVVGLLSFNNASLEQLTKSESASKQALQEEAARLPDVRVRAH